MSAKSSQGGMSAQSELRIVILGNAGDDKNKVVKSVLNCENLTGMKAGLCTLHQRDRDGRMISVVEAPGWDRSSKQQTPENIRGEVERSVSIFPPGPHALLLVIPVKSLSEEPSEHEITAAQTHMELLSERVWKHTILLFACDEGVEDTQLKEHIRSAEKILGKCGRRHYVLQKRAWESPAQSSELLMKIDDLVEENHGDFFTQAELKKHTTHEAVEENHGDFFTQADLTKHTTPEASGESEIRHRRGSLEKNPPNLNKDKGDSEEKKETVESDKPLEDIPKISMEFKQCVLILMGVVGALIGAVAGAEYGVSGSVAGLVFGVIVGVLLASIIKCIYTHIYSRSVKKPSDRANSD